jgi:hypothetical protein
MAPMESSRLQRALNFSERRLPLQKEASIAIALVFSTPSMPLAFDNMSEGLIRVLRYASIFRNHHHTLV